ncbi:aspartoacylase [Calothrix sp. 336/3]|uniref:aspartoacylase n=1 Tax=Calothrix sp. 336/3 TaxID=1337936 RepID=UPI0004E31DE8|nr:aspartoacylase [Calothrix sp. 336/3]AKG22990.1 aspartoacylase [Calothrix sp. 336/3]
MNQIHRVAIAGGTHGNEFIGAYLVQKLTQFPHLIQRRSFETITFLANPQAFQAVRRYIDTDLNRCFLPQDLQDESKNSYEEQLAKSISEKLVRNSTTRTDFILDLHSTTSNMGLTIILDNHHPFNFKIAALLQQINPLVKIYACSFDATAKSPFLNSLCELGFAIEVGAIPQGVLLANLFQQTETLVYQVLDLLDKLNLGENLTINQPITTYKHLTHIDYPRDKHGNLAAMVHPNLQNRDYEPLHPGEPMFITFDNHEILYEGESIVYPVFINEAAYYEKNIAMCFTEKNEVYLDSEI